jgi:hypothetical protein
LDDVHGSAGVGVSSALAAVVLVHRDPAKVRRLLGALDGIDIFLHCDRRTSDEALRRMLVGAGPRIQLVPRRRTSLSSWSLVEAELAGVQLALERSKAEHVIVLSGNCYPLTSAEQVVDELLSWRGLSRLRLNPIPYRRWDTPRNPNGGLWRFQRRFVTFRGQVVLMGGVPLRGFRRPIPEGVRLHGSSQWKIYARHHAAALLRILGERPDLVRFFRTTFVPEESCVASILRSPALSGSIVEEIRDDSPWYIKWPSGFGTFHPEWLGEGDFPALREARGAPLRDPDNDVIGAADRDYYRKLFARKLSSRQARLLDLIDRELRARPSASGGPAPSPRASSRESGSTERVGPASSRLPPGSGS